MLCNVGSFTVHFPSGEQPLWSLFRVVGELSGLRRHRCPCPSAEGQAAEALQSLPTALSPLSRVPSMLLAGCPGVHHLHWALGPLSV